MSREVHVRIWEGVGVRLPRATRREFALGIDPADVFEAQELEGAGLPAVGGRALAGKPPKEQHPGLVRSQLQSKLLHAVGECAVEVLGVALVLKRDDEIVHKARQIGFALPIFLGSLLKPEVEHIVQIDIGEAGRNRAALRGTGFRPRDDAVFHHARVEPFANQPCDHGVRNTQGDHLAQPLMIEMREIALDIRFVDMAHFPGHDVIAQRLQRHVRIAPGAVAKGAVEKIRFVNGTHNPCNCPLQQPILHRGDAEGARFAVALGNLDAPHWWGVVLAGSEPSPEILNAFRQVGLKLLDRLSIDAAGALAVELPPRVPQERGRQEMRQ